LTHVKAAAGTNSHESRAPQGIQAIDAPSSSTGNWNIEAANWFAAPAMFLGLWNPFLIGLTKSNGHAVVGFGTLASEWQSFVAHRLEQDMLLLQQLAQCRSPNEVAAAYTEFWQRAVTEYARESVTMSNLLAGISGKAVAVAQSVSEETTKRVPLSTRAA
jgi:hypothetical protein